MAQTYTHTPVLSKVKMGNTIYYLKDADVRAILDSFGNSVTYNVADAIADGNNNLVTSDQVYDFVNRQIGAVGDILTLRSETDHTTIETPAAGDFVVEEDGSEWLYDGTSWRVIGSENAYVLTPLPTFALKPSEAVSTKITSPLEGIKISLIAS